jgi:catechol 2,3-dioxygenase-like lactoylglutathione lyase family enzyme
MAQKQGDVMFASAKLQVIICTSKIQHAEQFYGGVLGLPLQARSQGALIYDVGGTPVRVSPVPSTRPSEHTVLGFAVPDIASAIAVLREHGVTLERFPGFSHDQSGVVSAPDGSRVAWFRDPDGNLLSVVQYPEP